MGLLDALLGRSKPAPADLDSLFSLPTAAITLQTGAGFSASGMGSVCYRAAEGSAAHQTQGDVLELLEADGGPPVERSEDGFGYTWLVAHRDADDVPGLVTDLHGVNSTLEARGFGAGLLCTLVGFADASGRRLALVYLYKQGSFYPFAPRAPQQRDSVLELQMRDLIGSDLPMEKDLSRWMPLWGAPGL